MKGATEENGWWFGCGFCTDKVIGRDEPVSIGRDEPVFNRSTSGFYKAEIVVMVCVKSPKEYTCLVLPVKVAEEAAQVNLDACFRGPTRQGTPHKAGKMWVSDNRKSKDAAKQALLDKEWNQLKDYLDNWDLAWDLALASVPE